MIYKIVDTETTGLGGEILEIASINVSTFGEICGPSIEDLVCPVEYEITPGAMATHHITPNVVEDCPPLFKVIDKYAMTSGYFIAHNAQFDLGMLPEGTIGKEVKILCTLKLAKALFGKDRFGDHKLSTLWYGYGLYKQDPTYKGVPHRAGYDCYMTAQVLNCMLDENDLTIECAYDLVNVPLCKTKCFMPKYKSKGLTWEQVKEQDPSYCSWLVNDYKGWNKDNKDMKEYLMGGSI